MPGDVSSRLAVLESEHEGIAARVEDYHKRLGTVEELSIRMDQKLDAVLEKLATVSKVEERLDKLEHWRTSLEGKWVVVAIVGAAFISGLTIVGTKLLDRALDAPPRQHIAPLDYDSMPINRDGTPKGWQLFRECGEDFAWTYQSLEMPEARQLRVWGPGTAEDYPASVIAKVWNWDSYWTVVWYEDGRYRGSMQRIWFNDPDYIANIDSLKAAGKTVSKSQRPRTTHFYFKARPSASAREIEVVATDRSGRRYSERITLPAKE